MKKELITCDVIQDLLPLYEDECCSEESKKIVENHLKECESCRKKSQLFAKNMPKLNDEEDVAEVKAIKKGAGKIKRIRAIGIAALVLAILVACIAIPVQNYRNGQGLPFESSKELNIAKEFLCALEDRDYEMAYTYFDIKGNYNNLILHQTEEVSPEGFKKITENGFEWYDKVCKEAFIENMLAAEAMDEMVASFAGCNIQKLDDEWQMDFEAKTTSGQDIVVNFIVSENGISSFSHDIDSTIGYDMFGNSVLDEKVEVKSICLDRFYRMPTINETIIGLLYEGTDFKWQKLFE